MKIKVENKQDALDLRWVQLALPDPDSEIRPYLRGIKKRSDGNIESTDGYRIHQGPTPEPLDVEEIGVDDVVQIKGGEALYKSAGREYLAAKIDNERYPDTDQFFPSGEPIAAIHINKEYLKDALEMPSNALLNRVIIKVYQESNPHVLVVEDPEGKYTACVMGMSEI